MPEIDPSSPKQAGDLLRAHRLRPQKRLGQNFLCDRNVIDKIVRSANLQPDDPVMEIGGGLGALTIALSPFCRSVTCIEIDRALEPALREVTQPFPNIRLVMQDVLRGDTGRLLEESFGDVAGVVVANIPYYITTPILERLLEHKARWKRAVLLVQQEFARRVAAPPGADECGAISLFAQYHAGVELLGIVPRTVFVPQPEVSSAILRLTPIVRGRVRVTSEQRLFHLIRAAFGQRRKTLLNALLRAPASFGLGFSLDDRPGAEAVLRLAGIDGSRRGETLSLEEFARISNAMDTTAS
ncbi:MAG TPA: 16S rRNA (adenine(1518)-N(6)/adenine(1519)-N(6))-dimethyltransferase RsmA [Chthonomonadales bacterium]|nr:16S rRNA (adenine(1518)-N(6)/adenine(1519)-N(6))-dimethyltransferase RsmA [Chthonomonadales bacterium]